jgi:hypothetical protein
MRERPRAARRRIRIVIEAGAPSRCRSTGGDRDHAPLAQPRHRAT